MGRSRRNIERFIAELLSLRDQQHRTLTRQYVPIENQLRAEYSNMVDRLLPVIRDFENGTIGEVALLESIRTELDSLSPTITDAAATLQQSGAVSGVEYGISAMRSGGMAVQFNRPLVESVQASLNYVSSQAFQDAVAGRGAYHGAKIGSMISEAVANGQNPRSTASQIRNYFQGQRVAPWFDIENLTRTTQLYSAREGTRISYERNGISEWLWIANIGDARTCMGCYMMHGTRHPVSEVLNDHHRGRCAMAPVTPTWEELGLNGQEVPYQTGVEYLQNAPENLQIQVMGIKTYEAWQAGRFELSPDLTEEYSNPIFGNMRRRRSLQSILGD